MRTAIVFVAVVFLAPVSAAAQPQKYEGRRLADVLRLLQDGGMRIVFSSETVTPDLRVKAEPRARSGRRMLGEILSPHGLEATDGPAGIVQVVRGRRRETTASRKPPSERAPRETSNEASIPYTERVTVAAPLGAHDPAGGRISLGRDDLQRLPGVLADDPIRSVQALPRVAASDDFRSDFSVRGSSYRHVGVVIDGVATPWLRHAPHGRGDSASMTMLTGDIVDSATLQTGAYPRRHDGGLGAQLELTLREGSRTSTGVRGIIGAANARVVAEGPLGRTQRGSYLFALRQSYRDWPSGPREFTGTMFGFTDAHAKIVYDVRPGQQVSLSMLAGRSAIDEHDEQTRYDFGDGTNQTSVVNVAWRSMLGSGLVLRQRAYVVAHDFLNKNRTEDYGGRGADREASYRADLARAVPGGVIEAGGQVQRARGSRHVIGDAVLSGSSWSRSAYMHATWSPVPRLTLAPGVRIADSTLSTHRPVSRWILGEWTLRPGWAVSASAGVSHQFAQLEHVMGPAAAQNVRPESATHADVGIERRLTASVRWQASFFNRSERDILREPDVRPRYENMLSGTSRGAEVLLERRSATGLSGWVAYSYGRTQYADAARGETFWGDFDQRHAINLVGMYRVSDRTSLAAQFRGGSNFPIPGYLVDRDGVLFDGDRRNTVRLPPYARLDVRANRSFTYAGRRLTLFVEVLNVLDRKNVGRATGRITRPGGEAVGFTEPLFPRRPSAGILIEF